MEYFSPDHIFFFSLVQWWWVCLSTDWSLTVSTQHESPGFSGIINNVLKVIKDSLLQTSNSVSYHWLLFQWILLFLLEITFPGENPSLFLGQGELVATALTDFLKGHWKGTAMQQKLHRAYWATFAHSPQYKKPCGVRIIFNYEVV